MARATICVVLRTFSLSIKFLLCDSTVCVDMRKPVLISLLVRPSARRFTTCFSLGDI